MIDAMAIRKNRLAMDSAFQEVEPQTSRSMIGRELAILPTKAAIWQNLMSKAASAFRLVEQPSDIFSDSSTAEFLSADLHAKQSRRAQLM